MAANSYWLGVARSISGLGKTPLLLFAPGGNSRADLAFETGSKAILAPADLPASIQWLMVGAFQLASRISHLGLEEVIMDFHVVEKSWKGWSKMLISAIARTRPFSVSFIAIY